MAKQALTKGRQYSPSYIKRTGAFQVIESLQGGREGLKEVLRWANGYKAKDLLALLEDARYTSKALKELAEMAEMDFHEFRDAVQTASRLRAHMLSGLTVDDNLPDIVADICKDARSILRTCERCAGSGVVKRGRKESTCVECEGKGKVRVMGDATNREFALKVGGLIKEGKGINIAAVFAAGGVPTLSERLKMIESPPVEVTVWPSSESTPSGSEESKPNSSG